MGDDLWIERYLSYLALEIRARSGGSIGLHYLRCAHGAYAEFLASGRPESRFSTWLAIRTCCQWLAQLRRTS